MAVAAGPAGIQVAQRYARRGVASNGRRRRAVVGPPPDVPVSNERVRPTRYFLPKMANA